MKGKILRFTLFSLVILSFAPPAFPQGPPIITDTAVISGIEGAASRSFVELNGTYAWKNEAGGEKVADSGGNTLFLSPGIQFIPWKPLLVEASFQIPVLDDLNGEQLEPDYAALMGFRWLIF
jgi:hypothetical protein